MSDRQKLIERLRTEGERERLRGARCPNCGKPVWNAKAHYVPGNYVTPSGWACETALLSRTVDQEVRSAR